MSDSLKSRAKGKLMADSNKEQNVSDIQVALAAVEALEAVQDADAALVTGMSKLHELEDQIRVIPTPDMVPRAGSNGKIDAGWLPIEEPSPTRDDVAGSYTSGGTGISNTGFKLADGSDIATLFGRLDSVSESVSGSGQLLSDISLSVSGSTLNVAKTMGNPSYCNHCTYCSGSTHCTYCNHCSYCSYCNQCAFCYDCTYDNNCHGDN